MTGAAVHQAVRAYLARVGCTFTSFSKACGVSASTIRGWRSKEPHIAAPYQRVAAFMEKHPRGFAGMQRTRLSRDKRGGGAAALISAIERSPAPARPSPQAVAAAALEDAWARQRRAHQSGRMVT